MKKQSARKAYLFAMLAVLFWSTAPTAFKLSLRHQDIYQLLLGASLSSSLALLMVILFSGRTASLRLLGKKDFIFSFFMALLNPVAYYLVLFKAYSLLPAQVAQPLNMIWPIVLVLISIPMLKQKIGWTSIAAMFISFSGVIIISLQGGDVGDAAGNRLGILLALSTSLLWSFYWIFNTRDKLDPVIRLFLNFMLASALLLLGGLFHGDPFPGSLHAWAGAAYVGCFEMGVTFVWWRMAMQLAPTTDRIGNLVYLAPFLNLLIVRQVLEEGIYHTTIWGILLLVTGILMQNAMKQSGKKSR